MGAADPVLEDKRDGLRSQVAWSGRPDGQRRRHHRFHIRAGQVDGVYRWRTGMRRGPDKMRARLNGFTMIELLLVLTIIGIITAVTLPSLMSSIRGNRLSTGARSIVMAGRYARSMAVMKQTEMALVLNLDTGQISVRAMPSDLFQRSVESAPVEKKPEARPRDEEPDLAAEENAKTNLQHSSAVIAGDEELSRRLDHVLIASVVLRETREIFSKGTCQILYRNNGTCEPYEIVIRDDVGDSLKIEVDALSSARVESE
ncbi:MAG: hypothetical protein C0404_06255 [Verrucomicrobia bacterium]|nr:hypothetical protein [Verrucomicrobiota bacterium]